MSIERFGTPKQGALPFAKAVQAGGFLYVSGQVPRDEKGEIVYGTMLTQAKVTLDNLKRIVENAGYSMNDVIKVEAWIDDPRDFGDFNKVYSTYFSAEHAPARVTVQSKMVSDVRLEVACIAYKEN